MDRQLIKTYFLLALCVALIAAFLPEVLGKTSKQLSTICARVDLLAYNLRAKEPPARLSGKPGKVIFMFDDGWDTQYMEGYGTLSKYGYRACVAVIPSLVGEAGYMNLNQLAHLYKDGWDMLNHTYSHTPLNREELSAQRLAVQEGRDWLVRNHLKRGEDILVFPEGAYNADTLELLHEGVFAAGRSLNAVWLTGEEAPMRDVQFYNLCTGEIVQNVTAHVDDAIQNQTTLILVVHKLEPETLNTGMQFDCAKFKEIVAYIHEREDSVEVLTLTELLRGQAKY